METGIKIGVMRDGAPALVDVTELSDEELHAAFTEYQALVVEIMVIKLVG